MPWICRNLCKPLPTKGAKPKYRYWKYCSNCHAQWDRSFIRCPCCHNVLRSDSRELEQKKREIKYIE